MRRGVTSIASVLNREKERRTGLSKSIALAELAVSWDRNMKGHFGVNSAVHSMKDGVLYVAVEEPAWAQQMSMMKRHILDSFKSSCDLDGVKDIRFGAFGSAEVKPPVDAPPFGHHESNDGAEESMSSASGVVFGSLGYKLPSGARRMLASGLRDAELASTGALSKCAICSLPFSGKGAYCPVCVIKPDPARLRDAVAYLMDCPLSDDDTIIQVCGLDKVDDTYGILREARRVAGARLSDEAIRKALGASGSLAEKRAARALLVASACSKVGLKPEDVEMSGLGSFFAAQLLLDMGISPLTDVENTSKEG